jgi:hypothetical protein
MYVVLAQTTEVGVSEFNPEEMKKLLLGETGVRTLLAPTFQRVRKEGCLGNFAISCFSEAVKAILVGLDEEATSLLHRSAEWVDAAIQSNEVSPGVNFPDYDKAHRYCTLALSKWLLFGEEDAQLFEKAANEAIRYTQKENDRVERAFALPLLLPARYFEQVVTIAEASRLSVSEASGRIKSPGKLCYLFAQAELTGSPEPRELQKAFDGYLRYQIPICLLIRHNGLGVPEEIPLWMLVYHRRFGGSDLPAFEITRKARQYIPVKDLSTRPEGGKHPAKGEPRQAAPDVSAPKKPFWKLW